MLLFNGILMIAGLIASLLVFLHFPKLPEWKWGKEAPISVIIPARNEENVLPMLLSDLKAQSVVPLEILVVDDCSTDQTAIVAEKFGAKVLRVERKPDGWLGKSYACHLGAENAKGDFLLFLDADVRLMPSAMSSLAAETGKGERVLSILPFHEMQKPYEQMSLFFNLIQPGAIGLTAVGRPAPSGLFGPVILFPKTLYQTSGGHEAVRNHLVDDLAMGRRLRKLGLSIQLLMGSGMISYRMYPDGIRSLCQGWIKNFAAGAEKSRFFLFIGIFGFIVSAATPILYGAIAAAEADWMAVGIYAAAYLVWVIELTRVSRRLGNFRWWAIVFYPLALLFFLAVFSISLFRRIFRLPVIWKNRKIDQGGYQ